MMFGAIAAVNSRMIAARVILERFREITGGLEFSTMRRNIAEGLEISTMRRKITGGLRLDTMRRWSAEVLLFLSFADLTTSWVTTPMGWP
jgi:FixJ family two-component response regulator